jgi:hypothetical protein
MKGISSRKTLFAQKRKRFFKKISGAPEHENPQMVCTQGFADQKRKEIRHGKSA